MSWLARETLAKKRAASSAAALEAVTPTKPRTGIGAKEDVVDITPPPPAPSLKRARMIFPQRQRKKIAAKVFHNGSVLHELMVDAANLESVALASTSIKHTYITCCSASEVMQ